MTLVALSALFTLIGLNLTGVFEVGSFLPSRVASLRARDPTLDSLLTGILAAQSFDSTLIGDESLSRRPMRRVIEPLARMGAQIQAQDGGLPPLRIQGGRALQGIAYALPVASAVVGVGLTR